MEFLLGFAEFAACALGVTVGVLLSYSAVGLILTQVTQARKADKIVH